MNTSFGATGLKSGFQLLPFILLLVVSSAFAQLQYEDLVPRYPQEMDGRVNMAKGRFSFAATDLVVPGRGLSIDFTRYYHGTAVSRMYRSYLGQGWSHSYQWELNYERIRPMVMGGNIIGMSLPAVVPNRRFKDIPSNGIGEDL